MIEDLIEPDSKDLGGFSVGRLLPKARRRSVGPFVFLDHLGPAVLRPPQAVDVRPHPHIGLSTLTYLFEGEILHHDNLGNDQPIRAGEVNWMTAGRGVVHSERTPAERVRSGQAVHGLQAWVALPDGKEEIDAAFSHHDVGDLTTYRADGLTARLVAGHAYGARAPAETYSPLYYVHWEMAAGARGAPPAGHGENAALVVRGEVEADGRRLPLGRLVIFARGSRPTFAATTDADVILLGGEPVGRRYLWWNFVSSSRERIEQAKTDWAQGRMSLPPSDDGDRIPLPSDPPPAPEPMS